MNLIFTTIGYNNFEIYKFWVDSGIDLILINYQKPETERDFEIDRYLTERCILYVHIDDFKYSALKRIFKLHQHLFQKYSYIWMPDDDVLISTEDVHKIFEFSKSQQISLMQPSQTKTNYSWPVLLTNFTSQFRRVKMIEIMCPLFSMEALNKCIDTFDECYSGWGLDAIWAKLLNYQNIYVYDQIQVTHTKPLNEGQGSLYKKLRDKGISDPRIEMNQLLNKYNVKLDFTEC